MPIYKVCRKEFCLGIWKTDETIEELVLLVPHGNRLMQDAIQQFSNDKRRKEWIAVRVLLFYLLGKECEIAYYSSGQPYFKDSPYYISISHTNGYVAVLLHSQRIVGIDIEQYSTKVLRIKNRFMHEDEGADGDELCMLLLHWCAKETLFKMLGERDVDFKKHLRIVPFSVKQDGVMRAYEYKTGKENSYTLFYRLEKDFVLTWCVK